MLKKTIFKIWEPINNVIKLITFMILLFHYLLNTKVFNFFISLPFIPKIISTPLQRLSAGIYIKGIALLDRGSRGSISRTDLIELALRNMQAKKARSFITIGGMAIGIGAIVFLVSIGYGLQQLVISRVARLEELKQADVYPQTGGKIKINDKTLSDFKGISNVDMVLPLIAVVGRVNYQNSVSDMAVYGVTADYLKQSASAKPVEGKIFNSNNISYILPKQAGEVAGVSTAAFLQKDFVVGGKLRDIEFSINPTVWVKVLDKPGIGGKLLGFSKRSEGKQTGEEVWGSEYLGDLENGKAGLDKNGTWLGKWIHTSTKLWKEQKCDLSNPDCSDDKYIVLREDGVQSQKPGFFTQVGIKTTDISIKESSVLGVTSDSGKTASGSGSLDFVEIASESAVVTIPKPKKIDLKASSVREAIVNRAMLKVLGIKEKEAVGKSFETSFVIIGDLLADNKDRLESNPASFTIVGVLSDDKTPVFYVPFIDLRSLGVVNFSQVKVVAKNPEDLAKVRKQIEAQGYLTRSVVDTVTQINSLFSTLRVVLALLGTGALAVASLGMFNTLTVSLLERTREVGLIKAMGMKSSEVKELFLTESMIMGLFGGLMGILFGFILGELLGFALSVFSVFKGSGFVDISYLPVPFLLLIVGLSLIVGIFTGIYPARRATKISALNALRYE